MCTWVSAPCGGPSTRTPPDAPKTRPRPGSHSLATKLTLWVVLLLGLFLVVSLAANLRAGRMIRARINDVVSAKLEQADLLLSVALREARDKGYVLSTNDFLVRYAEIAHKPDRNRYLEYQLVRDLSLEISYQAHADPDIWNVYILFADGGQAITSDPDFRSGELLRKLNWVDLALGVDGASAYIGHYFDEGMTKLHFLSAVTRADVVNRGLKSRVYIMANIDAANLYANLDTLRATEHTLVYLADENNVVICAADLTDLGKPLDDVLELDTDHAGLSVVQRVRLGRQGMHLVVERTNQVTNWRFVVLLPERELLREQRLFLAMSVSLLIVVSVFFSALAARVVARNIRRPVATLVDLMERAEREHFNLSVEHARPDELGYLFESFSGLVGRTRQLLDDLEQEHLREREMELKLLQSRINPHFLYNTLDTINWIAKEHGVEDISRIVVGLSDLYRTMFSRGRDVIEVDRMLQSLESYLYIQKFRFRNLSSYSFDVGAGVGDCLVLNLVVQPLVENAVIHGMEGDIRAGRIDVRVRREGSLLRFFIADNGAGMSESKLARVRENMASDAGGEASGLRNIQMRLQLFYGSSAGVSLRSEEGKGTEVEIVLPVSCPWPRPVV